MAPSQLRYDARAVYTSASEGHTVISGVLPITSPEASNHSKLTFEGPLGVNRHASGLLGKTSQSPVLRPGGVYPRFPAWF